MVSAAEQGNPSAIERLEGSPACPDILKYLWDYFIQLDNSRDRSWAESNLTYLEIFAWSRLRHIELDPWELDALLRVDAIYMTVQAEHKANDS